MSKTREELLRDYHTLNRMRVDVLARRDYWANGGSVGCADTAAEYAVEAGELEENMDTIGWELKDLELAREEESRVKENDRVIEATRRLVQERYDKTEKTVWGLKDQYDCALKNLLSAISDINDRLFKLEEKK